jgi:leucyl aminopeptidase
MNTTKLVVSHKKMENYAGELLVHLIGRDGHGALVGDEPFRPIIDSLAGYREFAGKKDELLLLYQPFGSMAQQVQFQRLLLVGLGNWDTIADLSEKYELLRIAGGAIATQCKACKVTTVGISLLPLAGVSVAEVAEYLSEGILLGDYRFNKYKTKCKEEDTYQGLKKIDLLLPGNTSALRRSAVKAGNSAYSVKVARDMANEPGNGWTPSHFANYAVDIAKTHNLHCTILEKKDMVDLGMGGILAVNKGSEEPPKVVILEYSPEKYKETILFVGKGLTFDSGGVSLKPAQGMMDMKYDMCGGAAVLAALETIGREKPPVRVVAIVPTTDNMAGGGAFKPGDVVTHYGGITTEIESTDAEGRLILADALAYGIEKFQPDFAIDLATLTGSMIMALGHHYAGLMSNNDKLSDKLIAAGKICSEPLWRMPMGEMYYKQLKSQIADIKNTGGKPAGCITAAEYLQQFVGKTPWAHLDIAGTAWNFTEKSYIPKGPSGFGVRLLIELIRRWDTSEGESGV